MLNRSESTNRRVLLNEELTFPNRQYADFDVELKHIKLVKPLVQLTMDRKVIPHSSCFPCVVRQCIIMVILSQSYLKDTMTNDCFTALTNINQLRQATRLRDAKHLNMFPTVTQLLAFDKKFGAFVTNTDLEGSATRTLSVLDQLFSSSIISVSLYVSCGVCYCIG
jgi:hypothetical protein